MAWRDRIDLDRLEPYWRTVTIWWSGRSLREQVLLGALAALAIFALLLLLLAPLRASRMDALADIRSAALLEARLRGAGGNLQPIGAFRTGAPLTVVADSAAAAQLQVQQIGNQGADVRVVLAPAPFDKVVSWIAEVERTSALRLRSAAIERQGAAGFVTAELAFGQ